MTTAHERATELWLMLHEIFDEFPDAILICDEHGMIRHVNHKAIITFGYGGGMSGPQRLLENEMIGQSVNVLLPDDKAGLHANYVTDYMKNPQSRPMGLGLLIQGKRKSGVLFYCEISLQPLVRTNPTQRRILVRLIPRDPPPHITLVAKAEEVEKALTERLTDLERQNRELAARLAQLGHE